MGSKELNILHIDTEKYWRGGQQQVVYLHSGLVNRGINSILVCNNSSELKNKCVAEKLAFVEIKMLGELDFIAAYTISKLCKEKKITIIHAHSAHALSIGLLVKFFFPSVVLIGVRRVDFPIKKNFFSRGKYRSKKINKIVCISDFIKSVLLSDGIDKEKLITIRSGVDIRKFDYVIPESNFRKDLDIMPDNILLGTVAAFAGHKDYPNLLQAFKIVRNEINNVKLCIVGDGPLKKEVKELADKLGIRDDIIFTGFREDVGKFLKSFDLFILASKKEGLGTSIIDALSVGLPIIATNTGGIPELINNGQNGLLVESKNSNSMAKAIISLIKNTEKRKLLGQNAFASAEKFSIENTIINNISMYKMMLENFEFDEK